MNCENCFKPSIKNFCLSKGCKICKCKKYIVLQDFWLEHIKLMKGQVITEPVSRRWIELRLIAPFCPNIEIGKREAQRIAEDLHTDKPLEKPNEVDESEIFVDANTSSGCCSGNSESNSDGSDGSDGSESSGTKKKRRRGRPKKSDTVIVELPEKSEILLQKMIEMEVDNL